MEQTKKKQTTGTKQKKEQSDWNIRPYLSIALLVFLLFCCCIAVICVVFKFTALQTLISRVLGVLQPILYGLVIGYLINPIMKFFERQLLRLAGHFGGEERAKKLVRTVSSILAVLVFLLVIGSILYLIIPQVTKSVMHLAETLPAQVNSFIVHMGSWDFADGQMARQLETYLTMIADYLETWLQDSFLPQVQDYIASITSGVINLLVALKNIIIGLIVSIYVLCEKERFEGQAKKIIFALFSPRQANVLVQVFHTSNHIFGGFVKGKLLDSAIIGVLCYICLAIIKMPYTVLVSVIVGVTNVIPFFGPFIGGIPCAFLILLSDPLYTLYFVIFIIVLQQVDGNIIGPKILGDSTGLSSFWVMFAIIVGSGLFGVPGMLFGCPVFAVIYYIIEKTVHHFLQKKRLPVDTEHYVEATGVEPDGGSLRYGLYAEDEASAKQRECEMPQPEEKEEKTVQ